VILYSQRNPALGQPFPTNTLDRLFAGEYATTQVAGFDAPGIAAAVPSLDTYTILFISTTRVPTHFVLAWSPNAAQIADPGQGPWSHFRPMTRRQRSRRRCSSGTCRRRRSLPAAAERSAATAERPAARKPGAGAGAPRPRRLQL